MNPSMGRNALEGGRKRPGYLETRYGKRSRGVDGNVGGIRKEREDDVHAFKGRDNSCGGHRHEAKGLSHGDGEPCCSECVSGPSGNMPACVLEHVLERLEGEDVAACSCVCRGWRDTVRIMGEHLWCRLYQSRFSDAARSESRHFKGSHCPGLLTNGSVSQAYATRIVAMRNWKAGIYRRDFMPTSLALEHRGGMEDQIDICEVCSLTIIGDYCVLGGISGRMKLVDLRSKQTLAWFDGHTDEVTDIDVVFQPEKNTLLVASTSHDRTARVWEVHVTQMQDSPAPLVVNALQVLSHSRAVFLVHLIDLPGRGYCRVFTTSGSEDDSLRRFEGHTWDINTGIHCFAPCQSSHFSTAGDILASADDSGFALFSLQDGCELARVPIIKKSGRGKDPGSSCALTSPVRRISLNRDASSDDSLMLVDVETNDGMFYLWRLSLERKSNGDIFLLGLQRLYVFKLPKNQHVVLSGFPDPWDGTYLCFATETLETGQQEIGLVNAQLQKISVWDISKKATIGTSEIKTNRFYSAFQALRDTRVSSREVTLTSVLVDCTGCAGLWTLPENSMLRMSHPLQGTNLTGAEGSGEGWAAYTSSWRWLVMRDTRGLHIYDFVPSILEIRGEATLADARALQSARDCERYGEEVEIVSGSISRTANSIIAGQGERRVNLFTDPRQANGQLSAARELHALRRELILATEKLHTASGLSKVDAFDAKAAAEVRERAEHASWMRWQSSLLERKDPGHEDPST